MSETPVLTMWQGKDIEKMSREELLDIVRKIGPRYLDMLKTRRI